VSPFTYEVFLEQNKLREDPKSFLPVLEKYLQTFDSLRGGFHDNPQFKGKEAVELAKQRTEGESAREPFEWNDCLALAARDHCLDIGPLGMVGHWGSQSLTMFDRMRAYGDAGWYRTENLSFGMSDP
jgi:uncharacterized protein YkwD